MQDKRGVITLPDGSISHAKSRLPSLTCTISQRQTRTQAWPPVDDCEANSGIEFRGSYPPGERGPAPPITETDTGTKPLAPRSAACPVGGCGEMCSDGTSRLAWSIGSVPRVRQEQATANYIQAGADQAGREARMRSVR